MRRSHLLLAVLVAVLWGVNFVVIDTGLRHFPPLLFAALRFAFVAVPGVFFVPRPQVGARWVILVGLFLGVGQFGLLFLGMSEGVPAGLASVVVQAQAVFTLLISAAALRERPSSRELAGLAVAVAGLVIVAAARGAGTALTPLLLVFGAAACWGTANVCIRLARPRDGLRLLVWASLVPPLPLAALSLLVEGPAADISALRGISWAGAGAVAYVAVLSTLVAYGIWTHLLRVYPASTVAPASLLVPVIGIAAAWTLLGEAPRPVEIIGAAVVLAGLLVINNVRPRRHPWVRRGPRAAADPATADPAAADPATADPATADPATADRAAADPATAHPETAHPETAHPDTAHAQTADPQTADRRAVRNLPSLPR